MKTKLLVKIEQLEFELSLETGLGLFAGPNGVGKSYIFQSIAGQGSAFQLGRFNAPRLNQNVPQVMVEIDGIKLQDRTREVLLLNHASLSGAAIALHVPSKEIGDIGSWAQSIMQTVRGDELIAELAQPFELEEIKRAPHQKAQLIERILYRSQPIPLQEIGKAFSRYHWEYVRLSYEKKSETSIVTMLGEPPWKTFNEALSELGLPYRAPLPI